MSEPEAHNIVGGKSKKTELKLINDGTYGCVFHPGLTCKGKTENLKYITKIQMNKRSIKNELRVSQKIKRIEGYARFFAPVLKHCSVKISKEHSDEMLKCGIFKTKDKNEVLSKSFISTKSRFIGDSDLSQYLLSNVKPSRFLSELWRTHSYVLKGIDKLASNGIVHYDLKDNNILFDSKLNVPIIIDYGLSFLKSDLKPENFESIFFTFADYSYWCIDIVVCSYIFREIGYNNSKTEKVGESELTEIYNVFLYGRDEVSDKERHIANRAFSIHSWNSSEQLSAFKTNFANYFGKFIGKTWWSVYEELIQFVDTWDNYSAAVIYAIMLDDARAANESTYEALIDSNKESMSRYLNVLSRVIYAMPNERPKIDETLRYIPK